MNRSQLREILDILHEKVGVEFIHYHKDAVINAITKERGNDDVDDYIEQLKINDNLVNRLASKILVGVTRFFRNPQFFETLKQHIPHKGFLRFWVVGCATGEEAYSLAIILEELGCNYEIIATDVSMDRVVQAHVGLYGNGIVSDISKERLERFFIRTSRGYQVKGLRHNITFKTLELFEDDAIEDIDVILCRNVLVYFDHSNYSYLYDKFYSSLNDEGLLCVGQIEQVKSALFEKVDECIYRKI